MEYPSASYGVNMAHHLYQYPGLLSYLKPKRGERILEVGCNKGILVQKLQKLGVDAVGIDVNGEAVSRRVVPEVQRMDAERLEFEDNSFDKIFSLHTIEHIPDVEKAVSEMARVLRPGGILVLVYPAEPFRGAWVLARALLAHGNPWYARKIHLHRLNPTKVAKMGEAAGLEHKASRFPFQYLAQYLTVLAKPGD